MLFKIALACWVLFAITQLLLWRENKRQKFYTQWNKYLIKTVIKLKDYPLNCCVLHTAPFRPEIGLWKIPNFWEEMEKARKDLEQAWLDRGFYWRHEKVPAKNIEDLACAPVKESVYRKTLQ